ncbi:hypothetical protein Tco_0383460 [Tanacetum coccineum]
MHLPLDVNKEEDDKMWTTAANVAATIGVGGCYGRNVKIVNRRALERTSVLQLAQGCIEASCTVSLQQFGPDNTVASWTHYIVVFTETLCSEVILYFLSHPRTVCTLHLLDDISDSLYRVDMRDLQSLVVTSSPMSQKIVVTASRFNRDAVMEENILDNGLGHVL